ncbi:CobN component of cobalt chelatase involved in B12 biosynthesis [Caenispirillum salinarum AK4]|uniref:Cobaltochelatase subunit CobN n=1 Tax=Caenispirillum salinarum AK4 TaxID=1238182 RepID=K9H651_9PROT|nr:cobaltochelatase subunit CobN [Caenispirillum salinarum]EKV32559.1 CobN component of cobalt chelatase involved in B12 biosynthesis [Caenispirillum salinarum AK4]
MHLLAATPGGIDDGSDAVDLGQTPADIVVLSAADSELACLSHARRALGEAVPSLRLASLLHLGHNMSVDLYVDSVISGARLVIVRLLGGRGYWPYGVEELERVCRRKGIALAFLPGDDKPDEDLARASSLDASARDRLWRYLIHGGTGNAEHYLRYAATLLGRDVEWQEPAPLPSAGLYPLGTTLDDMQAAWMPDAPVAAVVFYRALVQAGNTDVVDALCMSLRDQGVNALPLFVTSLKDPMAAGVVESVLGDAAPGVILNATGFAVAAPGNPKDTPFAVADCPVLQVVFAGSGEDGWREGARGLSSRDIAMNVALPEVDGRVLSRAISFKGLIRRDEDTQHDVVGHKPVADRVRFVAELAARWARLRRTPAEERRIGLVLANYPTRDGRLGNGVGLDTPAGTVAVLEALREAGYNLPDVPEDGDALIRTLQEGVTNDLTARDARTVRVVLPLDVYRAGFEALPEAVRAQVSDRWGAPEDDPHFRADHGGFALSVLPLGNVAVGIQPARGYNIDPVESYHDPALVPPHGYLAFYIWLRESFGAQAVVHMGKHGNLEWLPGKALALSEDCFPEAALGPMPHLYPFIVNDPGEGTQAKRRAQAVIIDHLTPPLTRAESYGPLKDLEALVDEYFEAAGVDPRRLKVLREEILSLARSTGLDDDLGIAPNDDADTALAKLDAHLCELKELQIRDGLHIFGRSPTGDQRTDLLVALGRVPPAGREDLALTRALAADLELAEGFDPLDCPPADPWEGARPAVLADIDSQTWRTTGDTVERLELLARALVEGSADADPAWTRTDAALAHVRETLAPAVDTSGEAELAGLLTGLAGRFVPPGPSGAPTRGRPDVLPTGRNFFSVDTRTVPTPAAWHLGWKSAGLLLERHWQDNGEWPRAMAITAWGTSNMRTGGDDIAQGLALMGVRPTWDSASRRVTGFEILPASVLDRPRVDVTLRISGFFRDAFPALIDLFDSAARAVADLDEPDDVNPLAGRVRADAAVLGGDETAARKRAASRVFGSKPGAYGAGLQAYIDEGGWDTDADLADAYVTWGGYAYGAGTEGAAEHELFRDRLSKVDAVVQNQDNREHDLLDSDDYYQFEGGMTAAVRTLSGRQPATYHPDHSRPESPRIRTLGEEIARIVRGRAANPKWIAGVMRHGYKGAFEMAATVDYLFAFAATAKCVSDHHFDAIFDAYMVDEDVRRFLADHNPAALSEMADRFDEAQRRGLWRSRRNDVPRVLDEIRETTKP